MPHAQQRAGHGGLLSECFYSDFGADKAHHTSDRPQRKAQGALIAERAEQLPE